MAGLRRGGHIIENDQTISVNNPAAIRAWQRAARWIGRISPPSVVAFRETDSLIAFDVGDAAFNRMWEGTTITRNGQYRQVHWQRSLADRQCRLYQHASRGVWSGGYPWRVGTCGLTVLGSSDGSDRAGSIPNQSGDRSDEGEGAGYLSPAAGRSRITSVYERACSAPVKCGGPRIRTGFEGLHTHRAFRTDRKARCGPSCRRTGKAINHNYGFQNRSTEVGPALQRSLGDARSWAA